MATIKSYSDLEQSKKLTEILPLESADMYYSLVPVREWKDKTDISKGIHVVFKDKIFAIEDLPNHEIGEGDVYAWSLAALLGVLPKRIELEGVAYELSIYLNGLYYWNINNGNLLLEVKGKDNLVDACYEMIIKLNELNLL